MTPATGRGLSFSTSTYLGAKKQTAQEQVLSGLAYGSQSKGHQKEATGDSNCRLPWGFCPAARLAVTEFSSCLWSKVRMLQRNSYGLSGCWKYHLLPIYLATMTLPEVIFSRPELTTGAQGQCWTTPGANGINNRAQVLIQGEGFHRANKHPVGSTGVHMAAGRTSALMTSGSFKKQSAGERHDLFGNANQHCQQALP